MFGRRRIIPRPRGRSNAIIAFPDDPDEGRFLPVGHPLTYSKLASYGFDPSAEVLLTLDVIASGIHKRP